MKQTNNAIKFLMAQYRAIFQNAYFKGLATAAVVTMAMAAGQAQATAQLSDLTGETASWGASSEDKISVSGEAAWNAALTVGESGASLTASGSAATVSGTGSLIINAGTGKAFTAHASGGALSIDIASIKVNSGGLTLTQDADAKHATIIADTITVGDGTGSADAIVTLGDASKAANAVLGDAASQITLNSDAKVVFQGSGSANAELNGTLVSANGALLDFTSGSGTLKVKGTAEQLNINVADGKTASIKLSEQTDVLSIQKGTIDIQNSGGKLTLAKGTLDLGSEVVLTNTTSGGGTFTINSGATLQANSSVIKKFVIEDNGDKAGKFALSGTWSLTGENNDLAGISITSADGALIKGTNVAVSDAISGASGTTIQADTLTLGKADVASKALLASGSAIAKDLVLLSSGDFNLADNITLTAVSGAADAKVADSVTLEEKIVLGTNGKGLTIKGGNYTAADVKVGSGSVTVTNHKDDVASTLTVGKLVLDNTAKSGSLTVKGAAAGDLEKVVLDLSNTDISYVKTSGASGTVALNADQATIKIGGEQLAKLLADSQLSGAIFDVKSGGQLLVADDFSLDASQIKQSNVTTNGIQLSQGTLAVDGTLTLTKAATVGLGKDDGTNILKAKTLDLQVATPASEASTLQSGTFVVSEGLKTNSQVGVVVGAKGKLELNDDTGSSRNIYAKSVNVSGDTATLAVTKGTWTLTDLTLGASGAASVISGAGLNASTLTVGDANAHLDLAKGATSNITKLTATAGKVNVADGARATIEQVKADVADAINVSGTVSVAGKVIEDDKGADTGYGVTLASGSVSMGQTGKLTFGDAATQAITVKKNGVDVFAGSFAEGAIKSVAGSEVAFSFDETTNFTADALKDLRKKIFGVSGDALVAGRINLGKATIAGIDENIVDNKISWDKVEGLSDAIGDTTSEKLSQAIITDVNSTDSIRGHYGAIQSTDTGAINIAGNTSLNNAAANNGMFAQGIDKQPSDFNVTVGTLELNNGGQAGKVSLAENTTLQIDGAQTTVEAIEGKKASVVLAQGATTVTNNVNIKNFTDVANSSLTVGKKLTLGDGLAAPEKTTILGSVKAGSAEFKADAVVSGDVEVTSGDLVAAKTFTATGNLKVKGNTTFTGTATLSGQQNEFAKVSFNASGNNFIKKGQTFASEVSLGTDADLIVGTDPTAAVVDGASAYLVTDKLSLNGNALVVDPSYNVESSIVVADQLSTIPAMDTKTDAGQLSGAGVVLQNSILAIGLDTTDKAAAVAKVKSELAPLFKANGALDKDNVGAVTYTAKAITLGAGDKLVVDSERSLSKFKTDAGAAGTAFATAVTDSEIYLGTNSALAVDGAAFGNNGKAAITLQDGSQIYAGAGSKVILTGKDAMNADGNKLFGVAGTSTTGLKLVGAGAGTNPTLRVQTINGWFFQDLAQADLVNNLNLDIDKTKADKDLEVVSAPVAHTLLSAAYGIHNYDEYLAKKTDGTWTDDMAQDVLGVVASSNLTYNKDTQQILENGTDITSNTARLNELGIDVDSTKKHGIVYLDATNALLENILFSNGSAVDAETNARLAVFGGAPQAAIEAGASTYEAISARMGVGVSGVSAAANGQGGAIWVTPVYKSAESDGFAADNKSYGADVKLYGLALGADIEVAPNFKVGGMFNVGSGDADGQGLGSNVSNDFDYYGLGLYAGYSMDAFSLVADVTYTAVDNDIEGNTDLGKVTTSIDSTNLSVGVTGQYKLSLAGMDVTPHAGLRYSMIDMDDYSTAYSQNDSDSLNIFSVPVGVTIAKEYVTDTWTVKPSFDLTLTGNFGDDEFEGNAQWATFSNLSTTVKSEIMDNFTYGAAVGVSATSGNFGLGLGVNYTGSSNTDEFGVNANARYMF